MLGARQGDVPPRMRSRPPEGDRQVSTEGECEVRNAPWYCVIPDKGRTAKTWGLGKASGESAGWRALRGAFLLEEMVRRYLVRAGKVVG